MRQHRLNSTTHRRVQQGRCHASMHHPKRIVVILRRFCRKHHTPLTHLRNLHPHQDRYRWQRQLSPLQCLQILKATHRPASLNRRHWIFPCNCASTSSAYPNISHKEFLSFIPPKLSDRSVCFPVKKKTLDLRPIGLKSSVTEDC